MTKKEVIKAMEGLDDDAQIYVKTTDNDNYLYNIAWAFDKIVGDDVQNEISFFCK